MWPFRSGCAYNKPQHYILSQGNTREMNILKCPICGASVYSFDDTISFGMCTPCLEYKCKVNSERELARREEYFKQHPDDD
jgi:hypothetical protein